MLRNIKTRRFFISLKNLWNNSEIDKSIIYIICSLTIFIAIVSLYWMLTDYKGMSWQYPASFQHIITLGFPFLFNLKKLKYPTIVLCLASLILRKGWIGFACVGITFIVMLWGYKKIVIGFITLTLAFSLLICKFSGESFLDDTRNRIAIYEIALNNWKNIFWGQGFDTFKTLKETQPNATFQDNRLYTRVHSDLIEVFYEFGLIRAILIIFLILLPLMFFKIHTLFDKTLFASYLSILFQSVFDFPFHRWTTGFLSLLIILLMYKQKFR